MGQYDNRITVPQVIRLMGIEPTNSLTWSAGLRAQALYAQEFGEQPPKDNRPKTSGVGVHCFALYPPGWQSRIEAIVRELTKGERDQFDLFEQPRP